MNNPFIKIEIQNEVIRVQNFMHTCTLSATKDDNKVDAEEAKTLKRIEKATGNYIKELEKLLK